VVMNDKIGADVIAAFAEEYSMDQVRELRRLAMTSLSQQLPRVEFTSASFDLGGAAGVFVDGDPAFLIKLFTRVMRKKEADEARSKFQSALP